MPRKPKEVQTDAPPDTSPKLRAKRVYREIDAELILEPLLPQREVFGDQELHGLIDSIKDIGLELPLLVEVEGDKFRTHAGHRRLVACKAAGLKQIPCLVYEAGTCDGETLKAHENMFREAVNPAEEARYLMRLLEARAGGDVDVLASQLHLTRGYIDSRLVLLQGDPRVFEALKVNVISVGVAHELNKVKDDPTRFMLLDAAAQGGATIAMVRQWRVEKNAQNDMYQPDLPTESAGGFPPPILPVMDMVCFLCRDPEETAGMELLYVHKVCRKVILDRWLERVTEGGV